MTRKNGEKKMTRNTPMTGSIAHVIGYGRAYIESVDLDAGIAMVRFDSGQGRRSRCHEFALGEIDFTNHVNGWKVLNAGRR
jgi:hypothetical protein